MKNIKIKILFLKNKTEANRILNNLISGNAAENIIKKFHLSKINAQDKNDKKQII